jgi:hypothetical protein
MVANAVAVASANAGLTTSIPLAAVAQAVAAVHADLTTGSGLQAVECRSRRRLPT